MDAEQSRALHGGPALVVGPQVRGRRADDGDPAGVVRGRGQEDRLCGRGQPAVAVEEGALDAVGQWQPNR